MSLTTIAVDAMGGDAGAPVTVPASLRFIEKNENAAIMLVGREEEILAALKANGAEPSDRVIIHNATEVVAMDEDPATALRKKKDSSMRVSMNLVKEQQAQCAISAGNTGALVATSKYVLKTYKGIDRPAICTIIPRRNGHNFVLDLGANIECPAHYLFEFGIMGSILCGEIDNNPSPRVGLLNIGEEDVKGNEAVKEAAKLMRESNLNYQGFAEGNDIYTGTFDVIVTDGFSGNIALKTSEGLASMVSSIIKEEFTKSPLNKIIGLISTPVLKRIRDRLDHRRYNGASLLGLTATVIKSHGSADADGFYHAIEVGYKQAVGQVSQKIGVALAQVEQSDPKIEKE